MASSSTPTLPVEAIESRNWVELPRDVTALILKKIGTIDILQSAQKVCMAWRSISKDPEMWRSIEMRTYGDVIWEDMEYDVEKMATHAIDRSCGQLLEFMVWGFGSDELLRYMGERSSHLRCLQLVYPYSISDEGLSEVVKKLPLLEELHIYSGFLSRHALVNVGRCCPRLKSLKYNNPGSRALPMEYDEDAVAIAETMPGLRHLQLFGNSLTNDGLNTILDGCPHLESLDLRRCYNLSLGRTLGRRCSERIKYLRRPHDSMDDCEFDTILYNGYDDDYSFDDEYISGFSDMDYVSDVDYREYYELSCGSDVSDYGELFFDE